MSCCWSRPGTLICISSATPFCNLLGALSAVRASRFLAVLARMHMIADATAVLCARAGVCVCVCVCYAPPSIPPTLLPHYRLAGTSIYVTPRHGSPTQRELCWCSPALSWYSAEQALHFPRTVPAPQEEYLIYY